MPSEVRIMNKCSVKCPTVRKQLRAEVAKNPWLVDEVFPQRKVVDSKLPITRDIPKRIIEPAAKLDIEELKIAQEALIVQEPIVISKKPAERDVEKVDFIEERELVVERIAERDDDEEADFVEERELVIEKTTEWDDEEVDIVTERELVAKVVQEISITEQPIIPTDRVDEKIEVAEIRKPVVDKIVRETKQILEANEKAEIEIDRTTTTPPEFELESKADVELRLPQDGKRVERREKEKDDDYDEFIDEELQKSLPIATAKQIPEEEEEEEAKAVRREKIPIRDVETDRRKLVGPFVPEEPHRVRVEDEEEIPAISTIEAELAHVSAAAEDACDDTCPLMKQQKERIMHKLEERQRIVDHYYLTKGFSYFEDVCTCSLACMLYTLSRDQFVRSIFASLALFAVGLKLCSELDAWEMPSRVS